VSYRILNPQENIAGFEGCIRSFIASHSTAEDRHELVLQLRSPHKPREILVQSFYYRLHEVNGYVEWLPGNEPQLNENQLQQAFFDPMPSSWRECFTQAGHSNDAMTLAQVLRYFRQQENLAIRKQVENEKFQRTSKGPATRDNKTRDTKPKNPYNKEDHGSRGPTMTSTKKPFTNKHKILDTDPCPIHNAPHHWGECRVNLYSEFNQKRLRRDDHNKKDNDSKKPTKSSTNFAIHSSNNDEDEKMNNVSPNGSILNQDMNTESEGNSFTVSTVLANTSSFALTGIFMSHFDFQENESSSSAAQHYMGYVSEMHILGDESDTEELYNSKDATASLYLCPIGLILAKTIQNIMSDRPLKTLFDPGSDKTFINRRVLPKGANGKTVDPLPVNTLNGVDMVNQEVGLEELTLPEFSAMQRIDKKSQLMFSINHPVLTILFLDLIY
jgi:hypothetical protein